MKRAAFYQDHEQSFWQLASIQAATFGLSGLLLGKALALQFGAGTALLSIGVGNLFLWVISLAIVGMSSGDRSHAISNARKFIGKFGSIIMALVLMAAILFWFTIQLRVSVDAFEELFQNSATWKKEYGVKIGIAFGFFISVISVGGIRFIKWICVGSLPFLFGYLLFLIFKSHHHVSFAGTWGIALPAVITTIAANLAAVVNLPTFFRHSRSPSDSFLALTLITLFLLFFRPLLFGLMEIIQRHLPSHRFSE